MSEENKLVLALVFIGALFVSVLTICSLVYYNNVNNTISHAADPAAMSCAIYGSTDAACIIASRSNVQHYKQELVHKK